MQNRLFNEYEAETPTGSELGKAIQKAVRPIVEEYARLGYALRDIEAVAESEIHAMMAEKRLRTAMHKRRSQELLGD